MSLIDIGANLTDHSFAEDLDDVLTNACRAGLSQLVITGTSMQGSKDALSLARKHPELLVATAGIHPHHAEEMTPDTRSRLKELARAPEIKAIGETGLDFFRDFSPRTMQISSFEAHIELAIESGLPLFLHERDAHPALEEVLTPYRDQLSDIVVHCFTGNKDALHAYLDLDCHIGITGWICDERRGTHLIPLVRDIPDNRLMIETDAPYLLPRTISPKPKSRRNEPGYLTFVCQFVADCLEIPYDQLAEATTRNAKRFFRLE